MDDPKLVEIRIDADGIDATITVDGVEMQDVMEYEIRHTARRFAEVRFRMADGSDEIVFASTVKVSGPVGDASASL